MALDARPSAPDSASSSSRRDFLFVAVVAWPLIPIIFGAPGSHASDASVQRRILDAQLWLHVLVGIVAILRARQGGRNRRFVAAITLVAWLINVFVMFYASIASGGPPL